MDKRPDGALCLWLLAIVGCGPTTVGDAVRKFNYTEVSPPSTFLSPGTVIVIRSHNPLVAGIVCTQSASVGPDFKVLRSSGPVVEYLHSHATEIHLDAAFLNSIASVKGELKFLSDVQLSLDNVTLLATSDTDVMDGIAKRSPTCVQAIQSHRARQDPVSLVVEVLQGDVVYSATWSANATLSAEAKLEALKYLAASLGVDASTATSEKLSGKQLFWGERDDADLVSPSREGLARAPGPGKRRQLLPIVVKSTGLSVDPVPEAK